MSNKKSLEEKKQKYLNRANHEPPLAPISQTISRNGSDQQDISFLQKHLTDLTEKKNELEAKLKRAHQLILKSIQEKKLLSDENLTLRMARLVCDVGVPTSLSENQWTLAPNEARIYNDHQNDMASLSQKPPSYVPRLIQKRDEISREELKRIEDKRNIIKNFIFMSKTKYQTGTLIDNNQVILIDKIGSGGFGSVWKAWDFVTSQLVAIKIIEAPKKELNIFAKHLKRELDIMMNTDHKNVVKCFRYFYVGEDTVAYVMEFCEKGNLFEVIRDVGHLTEKEAHAILVQIIDGLLALKSKDDGSNQTIIHYDLKPPNIVFNNLYIPKLCDFGLSKIIDSGQSVAQSCVGSGTPGYTAPEAFCQDVKLNQSADTWSIGIIYYEMLTGNFETKKYIITPPPGMTREAVITNGFKQMCEITKQNINNFKDAINFIISCTWSNPKERMKTSEIKHGDYYKKVF